MNRLKRYLKGCEELALMPECPQREILHCDMGLLWMTLTPAEQQAAARLTDENGRPVEGWTMSGYLKT